MMWWTTTAGLSAPLYCEHVRSTADGGATCPFPYYDASSRRSQLDHTIPYPHGPTEADNLGPPCPRHHYVKTHGGIYVPDNRKTLGLGAA